MIKKGDIISIYTPNGKTFAVIIKRLNRKIGENNSSIVGTYLAYTKQHRLITLLVTRTAPTVVFDDALDKFVFSNDEEFTYEFQEELLSETVEIPMWDTVLNTITTINEELSCI